MKRLLARPVLRCVLGWCGLLAVLTSAAGQSVTLAWNRSASPETLSYKIYYGRESGHYTGVVPAGQATSATVSGLTPGVTYYFAAKAFDGAGNESNFSNEIMAVAPNEPTLTPVQSAAGQFGFTLAGHAGSKYVVQASTDLIHWKSVQTNVAPFTFMDFDTLSHPQRFFRTVSL